MTRRKRLFRRLYGDAVARFESFSSLENELEIRPPKTVPSYNSTQHYLNVTLVSLAAVFVMLLPKFLGEECCVTRQEMNVTRDLQMAYG